MSFSVKNTLPDASGRKEFLDFVKNSFPKTEALLLGRSILSRDVDMYRIGAGKTNLLFVGAHHGAEYVTSSVLFEFVLLLSEAEVGGNSLYGLNPSVLFKKFSFWVVPCLNPDGVDLCIHGMYENPLKPRQQRMNPSGDFSVWQANARGVDLNHNYDFGFAEYKRLEEKAGILPGPTRFSGEYPESEPESRALAGACRTLLPALAVSLHSQGEEIYFQPKDRRTARLSELAHKLTGYSLREAEGLSAYGGFCDYTGAVLGIPSLTLEVGKGENPLPFSDLSAISSRILPLLVSLPTFL